MTIDGIAYGLASQGVLVAAVALVALEASGRRPGLAMRLAIVGMAIALPSAGPGRAVAEMFRGIWGDPSVVTAAALFGWMLVPRLAPVRPRGGDVLVALALLACLLYLPVFGVPGTANGVYRLGWGSAWLVLGVAAAGILAWRRGHGAWTTIFGLALAAWSVGLHESDNLWDSLVDPGLLGFLIVTGAIDRLTAPRGPSPSAA